MLRCWWSPMARTKTQINMIYHMPLYHIRPVQVPAVCWDAWDCNILPAFYGAVRAACVDRWRSVVGRAGEAAFVAWRRWRPESLQMKAEASVPAGQTESVLITTTQDKESTLWAQKTLSVKYELFRTYPSTPFTPTLFSPAPGDQPYNRVYAAFVLQQMCLNFNAQNTKIKSF